MLPFFANHYLATFPVSHFLLNLTIQRYCRWGYTLFFCPFLCKKATQPCGLGGKGSLFRGWQNQQGALPA